MTVITGNRAILDIFSAYGVEYIFGNPGTTEFGLVDTLEEYPGMDYILCLHEGVALGAAQMYANASGRTGVVNLHVAPGLGNALGALYNAFVGKMPLVVTAGQQDSRMLVREPLLAHDLEAMAKPLVKWSTQIHHPEEIPVVIPRAFKTAQDPPRGPVFIALPGNVLEAEIDLEPYVPGQLFRRTRPDPKGVAAAAEILAQAENPVIICGNGISASGAQEELVRISELLGAPVWNTMIMGALNFPTSHDHFRSLLPGEHSVIRKILAQADAVLAVGACLFEEIFYSEGSPFPEGCRLVQIDDASWEISKNLPVAVGISADPGFALSELIESLVARMSPDEHSRADARRKALTGQKQDERAHQKSRARETWDQEPISAARLMIEIQAALPPEAVVYSEAITATADVLRSILRDRPGSYFGNHGGGIGQALPGGIGVKLAMPDRPVVVISGDGSAMYSIQSFWTAARHQIPVTYIILANRSYRVLKYNLNRHRRVLGQDTTRPYPFMDLTGPDLNFVELARAMGVSGRCVSSPGGIKEALNEALAYKGPYVLEVVMEGRGPGEK